MSKTDELLPNYDQVIFNNSCLELCLAQLKYPPIQRFFDDTLVISYALVYVILMSFAIPRETVMMHGCVFSIPTCLA